MDISEGIFLPAILLLGIITSYQDIKFGKIKNKWIILGLIYAIFAYISLIAFFLLEGRLSTSYLIELATNFLFAIAIGFGFWYMKIWGAADGKLFIAFASLIPLSVYNYGYFKFTPSLTLLINIFLFAFIALFFNTLIKSKIKIIKKAVKEFLIEFFSIKNLFEQIIFIFSLLWVIQLSLSLVHIKSFVLVYGLTLLSSLAFQRKFQQNTTYILIFISVLRFVFDRSIYTIEFMTHFLILVFLTRFVGSFLKNYESNSRLGIFTREISADRLRKGMMLGESIIKKGNMTRKELDELKKQPNIQVIKYRGGYYVKGQKSSFGFDVFLGEEAESLTEEQISLIRKMKIKKIKINQTLPFAPFVFAGVLLTLIARGNILTFLNSFF